MSSSLKNSRVNLLDVTYIEIRKLKKKSELNNIIDLIDKKPRCEEEADAEQDDGQMREDRRVNGRHVPRHGADIRDSHGSVNVIM